MFSVRCCLYLDLLLVIHDLLLVINTEENENIERERRNWYFPFTLAVRKLVFRAWLLNFAAGASAYNQLGAGSSSVATGRVTRRRSGGVGTLRRSSFSDTPSGVQTLVNSDQQGSTVIRSGQQWSTVVNSPHCASPLIEQHHYHVIMWQFIHLMTIHK